MLASLCVYVHSNTCIAQLECQYNHGRVRVSVQAFIGALISLPFTLGRGGGLREQSFAVLLKEILLACLFATKTNLPSRREKRLCKHTKLP